MVQFIFLQALGVMGSDIDWRAAVDRRIPAKSAAVLAAERRQAFAWADKLGFPDVKQAKFVRVATGEPSRDQANPTNTYEFGFLLEDKDGSFKVFAVDWLHTWTYKRTPPDTPAHKRVDHEAADLDSFARDALKGGHFGHFYFTQQDVLFFLAWACSRRGVDGRAAELYAFADTMHRWEEDFRLGQEREPMRSLPQLAFKRWSQRTMTLEEKVGARLGDGEFRDALVAMDSAGPSQGKQPRKQVLARFEKIVNNCPRAKCYRQARKITDVLRQMVKEDEDHARRRLGAPPLDELERTEQVAELIFMLHDQTGFRHRESEPCDIFMNWTRRTDTPAHRLAALGYDAVPQLIDALKDRRLSRAGNGSFGQPRILTVGECAQQVLCRIAGLSFREPVYLAEADRTDLTPTQLVYAEIKAWYEELQAKGEKRLLFEATERGDADSPEQGARLVARHPKSALTALVNGARAAKTPPIRASLIRLSGGVEGEETIQLLLGLLKSEPSAEVRLAIARALHERNRPEGLAAMIAEWHAADKAGKPAADPEHVHALAEFLAQSGKLEGIAALARDYDSRSISLRTICVRNMDCDLNRKIFAAPPLKNGPPDATDKMRSAIETFLVHSLDDTDENWNWSWMIGAASLTFPRICDVAGVILNELDSQKYPFDPAATLAQRNIRIIELKNVWRQANKLAALPLPEPRKPPAAVPEKQLRPLLDKFLTTPAKPPEPTKVKLTGLIGLELFMNVPAKRPGESEIEQLGPGAVEGIMARLEKTKDAEDRKLLDRLAKRVSWTVTAIEYTEKSQKPSAAVAKVLEAMKGKPFHPKLFIQSMAAIHKEVPTVHGIYVLIHRPIGGAGVILSFDLLGPERAKRARQDAGFKDHPDDPKGSPNGIFCRRTMRWGNYTPVWGFGSTVEMPTLLSDTIIFSLDHDLEWPMESALINERVEIRQQFLGDWRK